MILSFIVYASIGRLIIFILQKFPFHKLPLIGGLFREGRFLQELISCDFCLGVWVFTILAYMMKIDLMSGWFDYRFFVTEFVTGAATSILVHLIRIGWQTEYTETVIEVE